LPKGSWYNESVTAVQKHRDELQAQEANEWAAKREPILQKLSVDIEKLRTSKAMSNREFCEVRCISALLADEPLAQDYYLM
jgi:hypothetical protein